MRRRTIQREEGKSVPGSASVEPRLTILDFNVLKIGRAAFAGIHLFCVPAMTLQRTDVHRKILWHDGPRPNHAGRSLK